MKKPTKKQLTYISSAFLCFFSLFAVMTAALAWFCQNRRVGGEMPTISANDKDVHAKFYLYKYTKDYNGDATDTDEETLEKFDLTNFKLNTYDTIFIYQNEYTGAILRMHLYGADVPTASVQDPKTINVEITRDTSKVDPEPIYENDITSEKFISSGADFSIGMLSNYASYTQNNDLDDITNISTFMQAADGYFKTGINGGTITPSNFCIINQNGTNSKHNSITLTLQYTSVTTIAGINHLNVLVYINYNEDLIEKFTGSDNLEVSNGLGANDVKLENDLKQLVVSVE